MSVQVKVPRLAESISEATLVEWLKADGATVRTDEPIATLETDKAAVEIVADASGVLSHARKAGEIVKVGDLLGEIAEGDGAEGVASTATTAAKRAASAPSKPAAGADGGATKTAATTTPAAARPAT
ncbi:MAG TPA: biotin/lipoyl-containing protein, partial [Candidatus Eisenbacteria bacterium]